MSRWQYRFVPRYLEFRRLPRWRSWGWIRFFAFLIGMALGVWGGARLLLYWYPTHRLQAALETYETEEKHLFTLLSHRDSIERLNRLADSLDRHLYHQIVPPIPSETLIPGKTTLPTVSAVLSEDTLYRYLTRVEEMLRILTRADEVLQNSELRSSRLPRRLPCQCPAMGAGPRELNHPLTGRSQPHKGVDFLITKGSLVWATAEGLVRSIEGSRKEGAEVLIQHTPNLATLYYPVIPEVEPGQWVAAGSIIGKVGQASVARMPFLHYEVWVDGRPADPFMFLWGELDLRERQQRKQALLLQTHGLH
ncbi:MAG: M23 family metallopeptidase [Bacteroidia bacterium]|nr:M23 family metallopeptidase [Bacteroidia bacterium]